MRSSTSRCARSMAPRGPLVVGADPSQQPLVEHREPVGPDRADSELLMPGRTDLARHHGAHGHAQRFGDGRGDHHTPARDAAHQRVRRDRAPCERVGEPTPGVDPVGEDAAPAHGYAPRMITAYVLIQTEVGKAANVAQTARKIDGVVSADDVTGPYDVIVRTEAPSLDDLGKLVVSKIQAVEGITRTFTCPVVNL